MRGCEIGVRLAAALLGAALVASLAAAAHPDEQDSSAGAPAAKRSAIALDDVSFGDGGTVSGIVVNHSADVLRDVHLLVRYDWQWADERNPGDDSPARSTYVAVQGDIPALGSRPFSFAPAAPLPDRDDGRFTPSVEVARYTQVSYKKGLRTER